MFKRVVSGQSGIDFVRIWDPPPEKDHEIANAVVGGGVATGDYDNDGLLDIFLTRPMGGQQLYRNLGGFRFENVTAATGLAGDFWSTGATFADVDNDGHLDLFVCAYDSPNRLYRNRGDGTFEEAASNAGLAFSGASVMMAFADVDLDGDLDGYLLTNRLTPAELAKPALVERNGQRVLPENYRELFNVMDRPDVGLGMVKGGQADRFYLNEGDGTFVERTSEAGMGGNFMGLSATWWDVDDDRYPDLYVANDFTGPDQLWHNNGDGTFTERSKDWLPHTPWFSMGADAADLDNDGRLDFIATDMAGTTHYKQKLSMGDMAESNWFLTFASPPQYMRNAVYRNTGAGRFQELAHLAGLANSDWTWSVKAADFDNDGRSDVYFTNGMTRNWFHSDLKAREKKLGAWKNTREMWLASPVNDDANLVFRNGGNWRFDDVSAAWGLGENSVSFGCSAVDLDNDGDLDLVVNNFEGPVFLYRNREKRNRCAVIELRGRESNRYGIGAKVTLEADAGRQMRYLTLARGFMSSDAPRLHFGLGEASQFDLAVVWPSGVRQRFERLRSGQHYVLEESGEKRTDDDGSQASPMFRHLPLPMEARHRERPFDDFKRQPLLPFKLSQLGPGQAWGDVDGDGDEDVYFGGGAGQEGRLFLNQPGGGFQLSGQADFGGFARNFEDMGSLFFDADADGDLDLYVVSGSVECDPTGKSSVLLRDRLYRNDGQGEFSIALQATPDIRDSGSVVCAADVDRDGDLDLFVGGRSVPGRYPETPSSRLLVNDDGTFTDGTERLAPGLQSTGLVTSALWTDVDDDGWLDLMVTHEWGPLKLWRNRQGKLVDAHETSGLERWTGWWNGLAGGDVDNDGDIDYVATNLGRNTKYRASAEKPVLLYYGHFGSRSGPRMIEAKMGYGGLLPVRGKSCSTNAMPHLARKFGTYEEFARASLTDIYTDVVLQSARRYAANTLDSGVFRNDGKGRFEFEALPRLAQIAPAFGVALTDIDGDGWSDLVLAQNHFTAQVETGRLDGGVSLVLRGGEAGFHVLEPGESGVMVPGDAKSVIVTDGNGDGRPDLSFTVNDDQPLFWANQLANSSGFALRLSGPEAIGARVSVNGSDVPNQMTEVYAGSGYLGQSSTTLYFGGRSGDSVEVTVRWGDGMTTHRTVDISGETIATLERELD